MSARGSTAKISSLSSMSPPLPASRVCTLTFILAFLAFVGVGGRLRAVLGRLGFFIFCGLGGLGGIGVGSSLGLRLRGSTSFLLGRNRRHFLVAGQRRNLVNGGLVDQTRFRHVDFAFLQRLQDSRRIRRGLRARKLDSVADRQPSALVTRNRALDEQQAADWVRADDL